MSEKRYCPTCNVTELHEVYFAENKSAYRCMSCDVIYDNADNVVFVRRSQPP